MGFGGSAILSRPASVVVVPGGLGDSGPTPDFAYSLRKLFTAYSGNAIEVRRSSDNTTQDIGFDANGDLDTTSLLSFVSGGSGYIRTWYDQSGHGYHQQQTTNANQYRIVNSGAVETKNNRPAARVTGTGQGMRLVSGTGFTYAGNAVTLAMVAAFSNGVTSFAPRFVTLLPTGLSDVDPAGAVLLYRRGSATPEEKWALRRNNVDYATLGGQYGTLQGVVSQINGSTYVLSVDGASGTGTATIGNFSVQEVTLGYSGSAYLSATDSFVSETIGWLSATTQPQRDQVNLNQANYYSLANRQVYAGPLDISGMPAASGAYSSRKLRNAYSGSALQVQRDSDNATQDIGFLSTGQLDTTSLSTFLGASTGYVRTWYDQSGSGHDLVQTTKSKMWKIYDATTGLVTRNSKPMLLSTDSARGMVTSTFADITTDTLTVCEIASMTSGVSSFSPRYFSLIPTGLTDSDVKGFLLRRNGGATPAQQWDIFRNNGIVKSAPGVYDTLAQISAEVNGSAYVLSVDGSVANATLALGNFQGSRYGLGYSGSAEISAPNALVGELIVWSVALSTEQRNAIEANQRSSFSTASPTGGDTGGGGGGGTGPDQYPPTTGWNLVWEDNFDVSYAGTSNGVYCPQAPKAKGISTLYDWGLYGPGANTGTAGVGERRPDQVIVHGGICEMIAKADNFSCSGMANLKGGGVTKAYKYGRWDIKCRSDQVAGYSPYILLWPASGNWPADGEVDVYENPKQNDVLHITVHWSSSNQQEGKTFTFDQEAWHVHTVIWEASYIDYYLDGVLLWHDTNLSHQPPGAMWLGLANDIKPWGQPAPAAGTQHSFYIDWVRIYQR